MAEREPYRAPTVQALERLSAEFDQDAMILVAWHQPENRTTITTYGRTATLKDGMALAGARVAKALGVDFAAMDPSEAAKNKATADAARKLFAVLAGNSPDTRECPPGTIMAFDELEDTLD